MKTKFIPILVLISCLTVVAQKKEPIKLILKLDENVSGPFGGKHSISCLRIYSDGRIVYASKWTTRGTVVDEKTEKKSNNERSKSLEFKMDELDVGELSDFLQSKVVKALPEKFAPPHPPIDYFEEITVQLNDLKGHMKKISMREFFVADLEEKSKYPSALIVLMGKIEEIEKLVENKGSTVMFPNDCSASK